MCGLVGLINKNSNGFSSNQQDVFRTLLFMDTLRGKDSTGAFVVNNLGNVKMAKNDTSAQAFIDSNEFNVLEKEAWNCGSIMVGHNRAATRGVVNDVNAHPFIVDDRIVLVHNGTFSGDHKAIKDTEVDSEAIAHVLADNDDVEIALRKVNAAFALIWYNVDTKTLHITRNNQRPLCWVETNDSIVIASEQCFLDFVISKYNLKPLKDCGPFLLKDEHLVSVVIEDKKIKTSFRDIDVGYHKHNKREVVSSSGFPHNGYRGYWGQDDYDALGDIVPYKFSNVSRHMGQNDAKVVGVASFQQRERVAKVLGKNGKATSKFEMEKLNDLYKEGDTIVVTIYDLVEADDNPRTNNWLMIGVTDDEHKLHAMFRMTSDDFEKNMRAADEVKFKLTYCGMTWQGVDHIPIKANIPFGENLGLVLVHGHTPEIIDETCIIDVYPTLEVA